MENFEFLNNFNFKKSLGQNFIFDTNFLHAMVEDAGVNENDEILEIGAGAGTLTKELSLKAQKVVSIEKDLELKELLLNKFNTSQNVKFIFGDFMKLSKEEIEKNFKKQYKVVANLPYYITTPIIFKIIEENFNAKSLTIMVQKEVAERLVAKPKTKSYGLITIKLNFISSVKILRNVPRTLFKPSPNVDSAIVQIEFNGNKLSDFKTACRLCDCAFRERRKVFASLICKEFGIEKQKVYEIFEKLGINPMCRGEELEAKTFLEIAKNI